MKIAETNKKEISFNPHMFNRGSKRNLSLEKIIETIKTGNINNKKAKFPKKYITRYFGKENITYFIIILEDEDFIEVITAWKKKGK